MATKNSSLRTDFQNINDSTDNNYTNITSIVDGNNLDELHGPQILQCFVCDIDVKGRYYALATCRTQNSRSKVIEKLGELVGERYMVVISEDDVICRSCANLINTLDRLETEMRNVRENVLRFLERKYSLKEGELLNDSEKPKPCQPPQITKCNLQNSNSYSKKRDATSSTIDNNKKKTNVWMQCDKCKYTTHHNSFMIHHIRDHIKQKVICDKCGVQISGNQEQKKHECDCKNGHDLFREKEKGFFTKNINENSMDIPIVEKSMQENIPLLSFHPYSQSQLSNQNENIPIIRLSNIDNLHIQNILGPDGTATSNQPMYVKVLQHINVNEEVMQPADVSMTNNETEMIVKVKDSTSKQLLTLTEDGNLEMIEVACWNDVQSSDADADPDIPF